MAELLIVSTSAVATSARHYGAGTLFRRWHHVMPASASYHGA
jgi:hypothetical protein